MCNKKNNRILFIASIPTKKKNSIDGETQKSFAVFNALHSIKNAKIDVINYTKNKYIQSIKLILKSIFHRYKCVFISKCIVGGTIAVHLLTKFSRNKNNIAFYIIGNGYKGFENCKMYLDDIKKCRHVIIEAPSVISQMEKIGVHECLILPCVKPNYMLPYLEKDYSSEAPLKAIFFSRVVEEKGVMDAVNVVKEINDRFGKTIYTLDIAGMVPKDVKCHNFEQKLIKTIAGDNNIHYLGTSFTIKGMESYLRLQQYDLHLFPTHFVQDCVPGSVIDLFIAGVPTLTSNYENAHHLMNDDDSFFCKMNDFNDLVNEMIFIYQNKNLLNAKRKACHSKSLQFMQDSFIKFLSDKSVLDFKIEQECI